MKTRIVSALIGLTVAMAQVTVSGGTVSPARTAVEGKNYTKAISLLENVAGKDAEQWYLLGKAYVGKGDKKKGHAAWNECIQINKNLASSDRWTFLFPPDKPLKGTQKKALKDAFESEFKTLNAIILRGEETLATAKTNAADRTRTDAKRSDATSKMLNRKADAKSESINDKQRMADRQAQTRRRTGGGMKLGIGAAVVILILIIAFIIFARSSGVADDDDDDFFDAPIGTRRHRVGRDDAIFAAGAFWYMGQYFASERHYYMHHGHHYTNAMYLDNYDRYGRGQGRNTDLDHELREDIEEREDLREAAAEVAHDADMARADADDLDQDADESEQRSDEYEDSADSFDDDEGFEDDSDAEGDDSEFADDEGAEEFEDDPEPEEEEFADDEEEFEDDPEPEEEEEKA